MTDQLISFETAKLAKEKGYPQNPYEGAHNRSMAYYPEFIDGSGKITLNHALFNLEHCLCITPSQSLLQKWLREKHNIHLQISAPPLTKQWKCMIEIPFSFKHITSYYLLNDSYESVLEEGLKTSLSLI